MSALGARCWSAQCQNALGTPRNLVRPWITTRPPAAQPTGSRRSTRIRRTAFAIAIGGMAAGGGSTRIQAWEGHDWNAWRRLTTWQKPELQTEQAGRNDLAPILGSAGHRVTSLDGWAAERSRVAATIRQVLGAPSNLTPPPVQARELGLVDEVDYTRRHVLIRSEPDDWIPAYLLVPKALSAARVPALICLHQTVAQGKDEPCGIRGDPELAFAVELVQRGFVCLAPDAIGFGERIAAGKQPYDDSIAFYRRHPRWSFMGKMVWDVSRAVDYLETLRFVDPKRIGSVGHSHGAYGTLFAAAFEPRLAAAVASCGFTTFRTDPQPQRWSHLTALIPQLGFYLPDVATIPFDWQHVLALAAPRRLYLWYTTGDAVFPRTENLESLLQDVQSVYRLHRAETSLAWQSSDGAHRFPRERREAAYRWLEEALAPPAPPVKSASAFFPGALVTRARANARDQAWAAEIRDSLVAAAAPWKEMSDDALWVLMFGNTLRRAWQVWSNGHCPACQKPVPMYEWIPDALRQPWKMRCPRCQELFPKNDFAKFYRSGLDEQHVFDPQRADRSLLFNTEHPDPSDPLHRFGVDDGDGYVADGQRWRFINAYLIFGQWKQAIVSGIRNLAAAYVATGDLVYAHKAGVLLDRIADLYPTFDFGNEGVMYEGPPHAGYVSTWHDACVEVHDLALAYDAVFEGLAGDPALVAFLAARAARHKLSNPKASFADIQRNIEARIFQDTLAHRPKIESNYPTTDVTITTLLTVLGWPGNRVDILARLDAILAKASAVDGVTGEKGIAGYSVIGPRLVGELLGRYARTEPGFLRDVLQRRPRLHAMYRFHLDTWCLGLYYPRSGDTGGFALRNPAYAGVAFAKNPGINPSSYTFLGELYEATGDVDFVRVLFGANGSSTAGLPYDLFAADPAGFQAKVATVIAASGAPLTLPSVNKTEWGLAILRSGEGARARAVWLDYDSGERHGHADAMTLGLFAHGLDLLPDFGYPPVQYGGWTSPRALWYTQTAAHNTVTVDGQNTKAGSGQTTLWFDGKEFKAVRASGPHLVGGQQYERTLTLVDISDNDSYVVDIFRVAGGTEHTRFLHGHFGALSVTGLAPVPSAKAPYGQVMRGFQRDANPSPGWSVTWNIEDPLKYLPPGGEARLRHTDLTRHAEVELAETWVAVDQYSGTADAWIPSVLVRRRSAEPPLASTFVGVLEPYVTQPALAGIRRLDLEDRDGNPCADGEVGIEIHLADGRRDVLLARNVDPQASSGSSLLVEKVNEVRFDGGLCLIRFNAARQPERLLFCQGTSLGAGSVAVQAKDKQACFELDVTPFIARMVAGPANAIERLEINGVRVWPK